MKREITLILAALMTIGCVSCGGSRDEAQPSLTDTSAETTTAAADGDITAKLEKRDFNETVINILGYGSSNAYNDADSFGAEQTGEIIDDAIYQRNIETEQLLNVKLEYNAGLGEREAMNLFRNGVAAGDQNCDILIYKAGYFGTFFTSGTLIPWDGVKGLSTDEPWYVKTANETINVGGRQYALFGDVSKTNITMCWTTAFNKRLVEDFGLGDMYEIVKSGGWTMDRVMSLTKDVYRDLNGNSERDEEDLYGYYTDSFATLDAFMVSHGLNATGKDKDGFPMTDFYSERLVKSFEKVYSLYWENEGTFVDTKEPYTYRFDFAQGRAVFAPMLMDYYISADLRSMNDDYGILPYPKLDEEQEEYSTFLLGRTGIAMLPADIAPEKLDMVGYVLDALNAYSYKYLRPAIYDLSLNTKGTRDEQSLEMIELIMASRNYDFAGFAEIGGSYPFTPAMTYRNLLAKKDVNITSYYESNKAAAESYFDSYRQIVE